MNPLGFKPDWRKDGATDQARVSWGWEGQTPAGLKALTRNILPEPGYNLDTLTTGVIFRCLKKKKSSHGLVPSMSANCWVNNGCDKREMISVDDESDGQSGFYSFLIKTGRRKHSHTKNTVHQARYSFTGTCQVNGNDSKYNIYLNATLSQ